jgi:hypothetical protein
VWWARIEGGGGGIAGARELFGKPSRRDAKVALNLAPLRLAPLRERAHESRLSPRLFRPLKHALPLTPRGS